MSTPLALAASGAKVLPERRGTPRVRGSDPDPRRDRLGFTWEYDLHLYFKLCFKRAKTLEATWGDADHRELIVRQVAG